MASPEMMFCERYYKKLKEAGMVKKKHGCVPAILWTVDHSLVYSFQNDHWYRDGKLFQYERELPLPQGLSEANHWFQKG